jgi:hypothetical protein
MASARGSALAKRARCGHDAPLCRRSASTRSSGPQTDLLQADREGHGGSDKALYAYVVEDLRWWEEKLVRSLPFGQFGENLTTEGIAVNDALVGERWEIGSTVLEVSERGCLAGGLELKCKISCSRAGLLKHCDLGHTCESLLRAT